MQFNVGYYDFSRNEGMNFQLNRFYSMGALEKDELTEIGKKATDFEKWIALFTRAGDEAAGEGDHLKAAVCYRAAQFYALSDARIPASSRCGHPGAQPFWDAIVPGSSGCG